MGEIKASFCNFYKREQLGDFVFASQDNEALAKWNLILNERISPGVANTFVE